MVRTHTHTHTKKTVSVYLLLALQRQQLLLDVGINKIGNVLAVPDLWDCVVLPAVVLENVLLYMNESKLN